MSFILDALRKSEHERQRSTVPGLSQVPLATPRTAVPRWTLVVIGALAVAVLALGGAWWRSTQATLLVQTSTSPLVERRVELPAPAVTTPAPIAAGASSSVTPVPQPAPTAPPSSESLRAAAATGSETASTLEDAAPEAAAPAPVDDAGTAARGRATQGAVAEPALPSATALAAEGITVPPLKLELHAYSERPRDRFVFINGRRYVENDRLPEGPQLVAIEPRGAVLSYLGRRFLLVAE